MTKATRRDWHVERLGQACREVTLSGQLTRLAGEAEVCGFPFTAEHLRHLAGFVLDEAAAKYGGGQAGLGGGDPGNA
jgi:hypothetical protein